MRAFFNKFLYRIAPFLLLTLLPIAIFYRAFLGNIIVAGDFTGSDLLDLHLPFKKILHDHWPKGQIPIWEPRLALGFPVIGEGQSGVFYPANIALSPLPPPVALNASIVLVFAIAAYGSYLYARAIHLSRFSSLVVAVVFAFSAFFVVRVKHLNLIAVAAWVPLLFWATRKLLLGKQLRFATMIAVIVSLQFLAGHPQMTFFSLFVLLIYFLYETIVAARREGMANVLPLSFLALFVIAILVPALSAVQILPTLELTFLSERREYSYATATAYPFHPKNLLTFISPYYFGNPARGTYREDIRETGIFWENASYIGLLPLLLALWSLLTALRRKPRPSHHLFFAALGLFSLFLMLGRATPIFTALWQLIPGFALFRFPTRFNLFLILALALLAGSGAELLVAKLTTLKIRPTSPQPSPDEARFSWPLTTWQTQAAIVGFILLDLTVFASSYIGYYPLTEFNKIPEVVDRIRSDERDGRLYSLTQYNQSPYAALGWKTAPETILAIRKAIPPNNNLLYDLSSFTDRGWFEGGLSLESRNRLENWLIRENQDPVLVGKVLGTVGVRYIVSFADALGIEIEKREEFDLGKEFAATLKLFENLQALPRLLFVPEAEVVPDPEAAFTRLIALEFLPNKTVILEKTPQEPPPQLPVALDLFREQNPVTIVSDAETEVAIEADLTNHGFLVLSDIYYPGWKAEVDGEPYEILRANYLVRALELWPGKHTIRFFYDPLPLKIGRLVSGVAWLSLTIGTIVQIAVSLIRRRKPRNKFSSGALDNRRKRTFFQKSR